MNQEAVTIKEKLVFHLMFFMTAAKAAPSGKRCGVKGFPLPDARRRRSGNPLRPTTAGQVAVRKRQRVSAAGG
jgi:hypothetical protein